MEKITIGNADLYLGDCAGILTSIEKADLVLTDPPYGISYKTNHRRILETPAKIENDDFPPLWSVHLAARILANGGAMYLATRIDTYDAWANQFPACGLTLKTPIFWDKGNHTAGDLEGDFGAQVEILIFAHKGTHKLRGKRLANLWRVPRDLAGAHPTPKPVHLMEKCISSSSDVDGIVLDPFMGSGSTGVAAMNLDRKFIGIEKDPKYFEIACERIRAAQSQQKLAF